MKIEKYLGEAKQVIWDVINDDPDTKSRVMTTYAYDSLLKIQAYKKLSMDRQGEIAIEVAKMIMGKK